MKIQERVDAIMAGTWKPPESGLSTFDTVWLRNAIREHLVDVANTVDPRVSCTICKEPINQATPTVMDPENWVIAHLRCFKEEQAGPMEETL